LFIPKNNYLVSRIWQIDNWTIRWGDPSAEWRICNARKAIRGSWFFLKITNSESGFSKAHKWVKTYWDWTM